MMKSVNLGIDLGTTNSLIARFEGNRVTVFKNPIGQKETLASVVAYRPDRILVGDKAREYMTKDPVNVFGNFKRKMGTDQKYYVVNLDENVTPIQLSTLVLRELRNFLPAGEIPEAAVITIPASFDTTQSSATMQAGKDAGFNHVFLLQEPIAASLAFFNEHPQARKDGYWLVYDFGGGTFDAALVRSSEEELKVVDHKGNNFLGGADFDAAIIDKIIVPAIITQTGITDFDDELRVKYGKYEKLYYEIMYYAEEAKKELSAAASTYIEFSAVLNDTRYDFSIPVTREAITEVFRPIIRETILLVQNLLEENKLTAADINEIILVGGSTFVPQVKEELLEAVGIPLNHSSDPTNSIAVGAAYYAANKYYESETPEIIGLSEILTDSLQPTPPPADNMQLELSYSTSSRSKEEVLLIFAEGNYEGRFFRIVRSDGGFDTGFIPFKAKKTEFLTLLPDMVNTFSFSVYDAQHNEIAVHTQQLSISQGKYLVDGQPLPHDISIEVDDLENYNTKLEAVFERNSLLPQKRTLYREISKTIKKGSSDTLVINILEGDKNARPASNLTIGFITISGKDLANDLVKGSDIEIQLQISDSRVLSTSVFLVMTQQEFKNVFSISEKHINLTRLREQYNQLESDLTSALHQFQANHDDIWEIKGTSLLESLRSLQPKLFKLKEKDKSDDKYIIAEKVRQISQEADKLGGKERFAGLVEQYLELKEQVNTSIQSTDFEREELRKRLQKVESSEQAFIRSGNVSAIADKIDQLHSIHWDALHNTISFLVSRYMQWRELPGDYYKDYRAAQTMIRMADKALQEEKYADFRRHAFSLTHMMAGADNPARENFKGTGIG